MPPSATTILSLGIALEHAVADQADHVGLEDLRECGVPLDVVRRLATRQGRRLSVDRVDRVGVQGDRQPVALSRSVYRVVVAVSHQGVGERQEHLDDAGAVSHALDLRRRELWVVRGDDEGAAKARVVVQPDLAEPCVVGAGDRRCGVGVRQRAEAEYVAADQDRAIDATPVEELADHEVGIGAGHRTVLREGIAAHRSHRIDVHVVLRQRELRGVDLLGPGERDAAQQSPAPLLRQVRRERLEAVPEVRVDVAVNGSDGVCTHDLLQAQYLTTTLFSWQNPSRASMPFSRP